jgi:hypothetical protein
MHAPDGPYLAHRDAQFVDLYSTLAWIHSYDAHAGHGSTVGAKFH